MSRLPLAACAAVGFGLGGSAVPAQAEHVYPKPGDRVYAHRITSLSGTVQCMPSERSTTRRTTAGARRQGGRRTARSRGADQKRTGTLRPPTPYTMRLAANGRRVHVSLPDRAETLPGNLDVGAFFCEPPQDFQYLRGGALRPRFVVPTSRFKRRRLELHLVTTEPFASPTWTGELRWDIRVRLRRYYPKPR